MLKQIQIGILVFLPVLAFAQVKISCPKLTDPSAAIFYIGVDNPVTITGAEPPEKFQVTISGGASITMTGSNNYLVRATTTDSVTVRVFRMNKQVLLRKFSCRVLPGPVTTIGGFLDSVFSKNKILSNPVLQVIQPGSLYQMHFQIIAFNLICSDGSESESAGSGQFSQEQLSIIKSAESGSHLIFDNIRCIGPDSRSIKLVPFRVRIQ
jgi:hypothetical protein